MFIPESMFYTESVFYTQSVMLSPRFIPESVFYTQSVVHSPQSVFYTDRLLTTLGVALVNNIERECFRISHPKSPPLSFENKLVFRFANQQRHVLLCWENNRRNPKLSSGCSSLREETLKCLWTGFYFETNRSVTSLLRSRYEGRHDSSPLTAAHSSPAFLSLCYWEPITCM